MFDLATKALQTLYNSHTREGETKAASKWYRNPRKDFPSQEAALVRKKKRDALILKKYLLNVDPSLSFRAEGLFTLPSDDLDVYEFFGGENLTLFNQVRVDCQCYIHYLPKLAVCILSNFFLQDAYISFFQAFYVRCDSVKNLKVALKRVKHIFYEQVSLIRLERTQPILHLMNFDDYSTSYELFYDRNFPLAKKYKPNSIYLHRLPESIPTPVDSVKINLIRERSFNLLKNFVSASLFNVFLFSGTVFMRVKVGIPLFERLKVGTNKVKNNSVNIAQSFLEPQTRSTFLRYLFSDEVSVKVCHVLKELRSPTGEKLFESFSDDPITAVHFEVMNCKGVQDTLTAIWNTNSGKPSGWYLESTMYKALDVTYYNLNTLSWNLYIEYGHPTQNSTFYKEFISNISMSDDGRIYFMNTRDIKVRSLVVKLKHKYWHLSSGFHLHITRFEAHDMGKVKDIDTDFEPGLQCYQVGSDTSVLRYGLSFWDPKWDYLLADNQHKQQWQAPSYKPLISEFFPMGIEHFIETAQSIVMAVNRSTID
ncbi:hypothetical protein POMI540_2507 [Schizosaccharomyces pombe]